MSAPIVNLNLFAMTEEQLVASMIAAIQTQLPMWTPVEGNTEVVLTEAAAVQVGVTLYTLNRLGRSVLDNLVALFGLTRNPATASTGTVTVTIAGATVGTRVLPAGSRFRIYFADGTSTDLLSLADVSGLPPTMTFAVPVVADVPGAFPNSIPAGSSATLVDTVSWVDSAVTTGTFLGGSNTEADAQFYPRALGYFAAQNRTLVTVPQFAAAALQTPGVGRSQVFNNWDNSGAAVGSVLGSLTVAIATLTGTACASNAKALVLSNLLGSAIAGLNIVIADPVLKPYVVTGTVNVAVGYGSATVLAAVVAALRTYLSPATYGWGQPIWANQLVVIAGEVPGVARVGSMDATVGGVASGSYVPGPTDMPSTITVNVTAI